jgi:hypothetical protein
MREKKLIPGQQTDIKCEGETAEGYEVLYKKVIIPL